MRRSVRALTLKSAAACFGFSRASGLAGTAIEEDAAATGIEIVPGLVQERVENESGFSTAGVDLRVVFAFVMTPIFQSVMTWKSFLLSHSRALWASTPGGSPWSFRAGRLSFSALSPTCGLGDFE